MRTPQIQSIDFRTQATRLDVPVFLFQGSYEAPAGRATLADEWFRRIHAPHKQMTIADTSGHRPLEQPDVFARFLTDTVLRQTDGAVISHLDAEGRRHGSGGVCGSRRRQMTMAAT